MDKFEYKTVNFESKGFLKSKITPEEEMNKLGAEGWELVTSNTTILSGKTTEATYIFKRKI
ncbi:DUF4177 domain-containing protein [Bacillus sp. BGMRC 2118]|nr:DUF4177 domain-containing protein [Bacillus sp. BGMRC 2118]